MGNPEKKVIEIKNSTDTEIKDKLSENRAASRLTDNNETYFQAAFKQELIPAGIDIFDNSKSELIRQGNTLVITNKNADGTLTPKLVIDGGTWNKTYDLTVNFVKYLTNVPLRMIYQDVSIDIEKNKEVTSVVATTNKDITDVYKEIPTKERLKELIKAVDDQYQEALSLINAYRKDGIIGGFKLRMDEQQTNNVEILKKMAKGHAEDLHIINERFYNITGVDAINGKNNPDLEKDLANPMYKETFVKYNTSLLYMSQQLNKIMLLTNDPDFIRGKYKLSDTDLVDFGIYGKHRLESFGKLLQINKNIDKDRVEEMMKVAMIQLEDSDWKSLFAYLKDVAENRKDPKKEPFLAKNVEKVQKLVDMYPFLREYGLLNVIKDQKGEQGKEDLKQLKDKDSYSPVDLSGAETKQEDSKDNTDKKKEESPDYGGMGIWDTFKKGGIRGTVRKIFDIFPQMADSTKNTWTSLLVAGGVGFGVWKLGKWLFSGKWNKDQKEKTPFRQRALIVGGVTLGFNAFGSNPFKFASEIIGGGFDPSAFKMDFSKLGFFGGSKESNEKAQENGEVDVRSTVEIFGKTPIEKLSTYIDPKTMELTTGGYSGLLAHFNALEEEAATDTDKAAYRAKKDLVQKIWNNKDKGILKNSFAMLGITPDNLKTLQGSVSDQATRNIPADGGKEFRDEKDDAHIAEQVKGFSSLTEPQKNILIKHGNILYDQKPSGPEQKVEFKEADGKIYLQTYGERTPIGTNKNIGQLSIEGLNGVTGPIVFSDYNELLKAANLTNYMKAIYRGKSTGALYEPFEKGGFISSFGSDRGDIMHKNSDTEKNSISDYFDKEAISTGWFGNLKKTSPKLNDHVESYVNYLNKLNIRNEKQRDVNRPTGIAKNYFESQPDKKPDEKKNTETSNFDQATETLVIGGKKYFFSVREKTGSLWAHNIHVQDWLDVLLKDANVKTTLDGLGKVGDETTSTYQIDGKEVKITMKRTM